MKTAVLLLSAIGLAATCGCLHAPPAKVTPPLSATNAVSASTNTNAPAADSADERTDEAYRQMRLLTKAIMLIRHDYVDDSKTSYSNLIHSALGGMLQSLDPFSQFLEPSGYKDLKEETQGEFGGLGIVVGTRDNMLSVIAPMEDTPAYRAGILAGDKIAEINGEKTDGLSIRDAVRKLRGEKGTTVRLTILRGSERKEFTLTREAIVVSTVKGARILEDGIGYVRVTEFSEPSGRLLDQAIEKLRQKGLKALVLDLRNNPGGLLTSAIEVSQLFLKPGTLIVSTRGRGGVARQAPAKAGGARRYTDIPLAILVNHGSASASEIVAGALQDNKRAVLVGETTYGKGSVQNIMPVDDGYALRLTTARYYTPSGRCIHEKGIEPDIVVPMSTEEWINAMTKRSYEESPELFSDKTKPAANMDSIVDRQLERAVDVLKGILVFRAND